MAITIDWGTKIISVPKSDLTLIQLDPIEVRELDLNWFRLQLKDLEDSEDGMVHLDTHQHNPPVTVGGVTLARVVEIINGYTVTFEDGQYAVNLQGANTNVGDVVNLNQVSVRSSNSAGLVTSAGIEAIEYNGKVYIDVLNGENGTIYPIGTLRRPVNNMSDAVFIANNRGFNGIYVLNNMNFDSDADIDEFIIEGDSSITTKIGVNDTASVSGCTILHCDITGVLSKNTILNYCRVGDLTYFDGEIRNCGLYGNIYLQEQSDIGSALFINCYTSDKDRLPIIDMGNSGQDLCMPNYAGYINIQNLSSISEEIDISLNAGLVVLDSTISAGQVTINGNGQVINNSTGSTIVNTSGLLSKSDIVAETWAYKR
jgi:hypothetical protein